LVNDEDCDAEIKPEKSLFITDFNQFVNKITLPKNSGIYFIKIEGFESEILKVVKN